MISDSIIHKLSFMSRIKGVSGKERHKVWLEFGKVG